MSTTWKELKDDIRGRVFPQGEATNLVVAHDAILIDGIMDLQKWVPCLQQDNTQIIPQCATYYKCGLTVFEAPRGYIKRLSTIDRIDPDTCLEDATLDPDYCREIFYAQIEPCHILRWMELNRRGGCCFPISPFFGLPSCCQKPVYPTPTDAGLPPGLPPLPLGFHYAQGSTDRTYLRRSPAGVWAIERGKIYVAPWIQSTEEIHLFWDGLKRSWADNDIIDDDPDLQRALSEYLRWQHADKYEHDESEAASAREAYNEARALLMRECREETRVRECEPSQARSSSVSITTLYYNDTEGKGYATCPAGTEGDATTSTVAVGTVSSSVSVADANKTAQDQAQADAEAKLSCSGAPTVVYKTSRDFVGIAVCLHETGAPTPTGDPVSITIPKGTPYPAATSQVEADSLAAADAQAQADAALAEAGHCTWHCRAVTMTAVCSTDASISATGTVAQGEAAFDSTVSQSSADAAAAVEAQNRANAALDALGTCGTSTPIYNSDQAGMYLKSDCYVPNLPAFATQIRINWHVAAGSVSVPGGTAVDANNSARSFGQTQAFLWAQQLCAQRRFGNFNLELP